jgi:purine nucleosidase
LKPELFSGRKVHVAVECESSLTLGMTVVDWWAVTERTPNVQFMRDIDADGYFDLVIERLARL